MALSPQETRLCALIAKRGPQLLDDLRRHVSLPTGPGGTGLDETREVLCGRLAALGAQLRMQAGDTRAAWLSGGSAAASAAPLSPLPPPPPPPPPPTAIARRWKRERRVLLCGHLDTVHPANSGFRTLSISGDGATATGPGCVDMKGGLVILVAALEALEEAGLDASWGVIFNSDEETGSYHSDRAIREEAAAGYAAGLVVEPALPDGSLVTHRPGSGQFMVEARGTPAHVGRDFLKGASAISALAAMIGKIDQLGDPVPPPNGRGLIVNVGVIEGGTATNVVAESARAWGNIRFPDTAAGSALEGQLVAMAHGDNASKLQMTVRTSVNRPAKPLTAATQALAESARAAAIDLGQAMPFATTGGVCDGNNMQAAGLPTIDTLGVRGGGLHTPQEWIELRSLVERCQLLAVMVGRLTAGT